MSRLHPAGLPGTAEVLLPAVAPLQGPTEGQHLPPADLPGQCAGAGPGQVSGQDAQRHAGPGLLGLLPGTEGHDLPD